MDAAATRQAPRRRRTSVRPLRWVLMLLSVVALRCEENTTTISPSDALVDPRIAPFVLYTNPALSSLGPYDGWDAASYPPVPRIEVRFSKMMDLRSVIRGVRLSSSRRKLSLDTLTTENVNRESFFFSMNGVTEPDFRACEVLTLALGQPVADVNGNSIAPCTLGTMTPEPVFRVRRVVPPDAWTLPSDTAAVFTLYFNSAVDGSILPYLGVTPSGRTSSAIGWDSMSVQLRAVFDAPAEEYRISLGAGAPDAQGRRTAQPWSATYPGALFELSRTPPDSAMVSMNEEYRISAELAIDPATFPGAFHVTPEAAGGMHMHYEAGSVWVRPAVEYAPDTRYVIRIDTTLRSTGGFRLPRELTFAFRTAAFGVIGTNPRDLDEGISRRTPIVVKFPAILDSSTVRTSFQITPQAAGKFGVFPNSLEADYILFFPGDSLLAHQIYTITIDSTLRTRGGAGLAAPDVFTFTTGAQ